MKSPTPADSSSALALWGPTGAGFIPTLGSGLLPCVRTARRGVEASGQGRADPSTPLPCGVLPVALTSRLMEIPTG